MPVGIWKSNARYYVQADHLNTARAILDQTGTVIWLWKADPFGTINPTADPDKNGVTFAYNLRFPGQYYDQETGLFYNYSRDYDPRTGRYVESDPIGLAGGLNRYAYVFNALTGYIDPLELDVWLEGPAGPEPSFHQSLNVGDPFGRYDSYSFGINGDGLEGEVYRDAVLGGPIESYKKTTPEEDKIVRDWLEGQVGETGTYGLNDICRSWSQRQFGIAPGIPTAPPTRTNIPHTNVGSSSSQVTSQVGSTPGTWTSQ